jgi:hypothetical protein
LLFPEQEILTAEEMLQPMYCLSQRETTSKQENPKSNFRGLSLVYSSVHTFLCTFFLCFKRHDTAAAAPDEFPALFT